MRHGGQGRPSPWRCSGGATRPRRDRYSRGAGKARDGRPCLRGARAVVLSRARKTCLATRSRGIVRLTRFGCGGGASSPASIVSLCLGACAPCGAVERSEPSVLAFRRAALLPNEDLRAVFVGAAMIGRSLGDVVVELEAADRVEGRVDEQVGIGVGALVAQQARMEDAETGIDQQVEYPDGPRRSG